MLAIARLWLLGLLLRLKLCSETAVAATAAAVAMVVVAMAAAAETVFPCLLRAESGSIFPAARLLRRTQAEAAAGAITVAVVTEEILLSHSMRKMSESMRIMRVSTVWGLLTLHIRTDIPVAAVTESLNGTAGGRLMRLPVFFV